MLVHLTGSSDNPSTPSNGSIVLESKTEPLTKKPSLYNVIILNDDYTPMEFVVYILQTFFGMGKDKATQIMLSVHSNGKGICGIFTKEIAETKSQQVNNFAKQNEHPLISDIEEAGEE